MSGRQELIHLDITTFAGENSKSNPENLEASQLREAVNCESYSVQSGLRKVRGTIPLLTSPYVEGGVVKPIKWVAPYKFPDANGELVRQQVFQAGTALLKLLPDGSTSVLQPGLTEGLIRTHDQLDQHLLITGQDPYLVGHKDQMMKYDGVSVQNWGVTAPGAEETVMESFANPATFTVAPGVLLAENRITWDGDSIQLYNNVPVAGLYGVTFSKTPTISVTVPNDTGVPDVVNRGRLHVYLDPKYFGSVVAGLNTFRVFIGNDVGNRWRFDFFPGEFTPGWNLLQIDFTLPTATIGAPSALNVDYVRIEITTKVILQGIYIDRLVIFDRGTPRPILLYTTPAVQDYEYDDVPGLLLDACDAIGAVWTITSTGAFATLAVDSGDKREGTGSLTYTGVPAAVHSVTFTAAIAQATGAITDWGFWLKLSNKVDVPTPTTTCVTFTVANGANSRAWPFQTSQLIAGWQFLKTSMAGTPVDGGAGLPGTSATISIKVDFASYTAAGPTIAHVDQLTTFHNSYSSNGGNYLVTDTVDFKETTASVVANKTDPQVNTLEITKLLPAPLSLYSGGTPLPAGGRWLGWAYIPTIGNLADTAISVWIGDNNLENAFRYNVRKADLKSGWNEFLVQLDAHADSTGSGANFSSITRITVIFNFQSVGTQESGYKIDAFHHAEAVGALVGDYTYKVTYVTKFGIESNSGPVSPVISCPLSGATVRLLDVPVSSDAQVVARNLYRTVAGGSEWLFLGNIPDNTTVQFDDSIVDVGTNTPPEAGADIFDSSPPPRAGIVRVWRRTIFMAGDPLNPHILYFSKDDDIDSFPLRNTFELDSRITGIYEAYLALVITTDTDTWRIFGDNPDFVLEKVVQEVGALNPRAVGTAKMEGWSVDQYGLRLYNLQEMSRVSEPIGDKYVLLPHREDVFTVHSKRHNALVQFNKGVDGKYLENFLYTYPMDMLRSGSWSRLVIPATTGIDFQCCAEVEDDSGTIHLYAGSSDGQLYELFADSAQQWTGAGTSVPIEMRVQTRWIRPGILGRELWLATGKFTPRFFELRAQELNGQDHDWTAVIQTSFASADNASVNAGIKDTATLTLHFPPGETMVRLPLKQKTSGEWVRLRLINSNVNRDVVLLGYRISGWITPSQAEYDPAPGEQSSA